MTVLVDVAGWGCLVGGILVGVYREEAEQFAYSVVEPHFFQREAFEQKVYLAEAARQAVECLERLNVHEDELVRVSAGYVLDGVCARLSGEGYTCRRVNSAGLLRDKLACALQEHLEGMGLEVELSLLTHPRKKGLFWWHQVKWLKGGNPYREGYVQDRAARCKTGWWSFRIWANHAYPVAKRLVRRARQQRRLERGRWAK